MKKSFFLTLLLGFAYQIATSQTILTADGPGNTYELINAVLAPGYNAVEHPDCSHNSFSRHIEEVFDTDLNKYVFLFHIHSLPDNDRCINIDRQRNEIKTYDKSPDSLLGVLQERVEYQWKFKLDSAFQPSTKFTHIHQLKAVGGSESSMPLITLTPRKANPDKLQLRYADALTQSTIYETDLAPFKGVWIQAKETVLYDEVGLGQYEILLTKIQGGDTLFHYTNAAIRMWKTNATFIRPKWGIYRSLQDSASLRNEQVLFADFSIEELDNTVATIDLSTVGDLQVYPNPATDVLYFSEEVVDRFDYFNMYNSSGQVVVSQKLASNKVAISHLPSGIYFVEFKTATVRAKPIKILIK